MKSKTENTGKKIRNIINKSNHTILLLIFFVFTLNITKTHASNDITTNSYNYAHYGKSFIFSVNQVEFSVFPDGQFDFNLLRNNSSVNISINTGNTSISFNSGYNYNSYVQYDEYGAIIQIENIPIYYDDFGRIIGAGSTNISYNNLGFVSRVGGLNIFYNNHNQFIHTSGFINIYNRGYIYRPWHRYYCVPRPNYCVVYSRPYRTLYRPVRYRYTRPFINNNRPRTAIANRRGAAITRNRSYATAYRSSKNIRPVNRSAYRKPVANRNHNNRSTAKTTRNNSKNVARTQAQRNSKKTQSNYRKTNSKNNAVVKNPNNKNPRTYNSNSRKSQQAVNKSNNNGNTKRPKTTRLNNNNNKQRTAQNYSRKSNNNTRSTARRTRS
ncbi:hypothetical protein [Pseudotamlana carrageenivorans]|uniref:Uncharacterized protein n=1 Tax=Pseudotamlana carrageenivorans TaxID=2069432 RepID=A0A2I7SL99_9FLAO|nr:hypothetical protein [Tamlana carrageenivorans]AUS06662.1 hypothetical protein C1A40_14960 [Tamlana carrageenivorans]